MGILKWHYFVQLYGSSDSELTFDIFIWLAVLVKCLVNAYKMWLMHVHPVVLVVFVVVGVVVVVICADSLLNF